MDLLGRGRVARRRSRTGLLLAAGTAVALALPPVAFADDTANLKAQLKALTEQLKALAAQNQEQNAEVKALGDQVQQLKDAAAAKPPQPALTILPPGKKPGPDDSDVAVTEQPGNVVGKGAYPPGLANAAPGYPYPAGQTTPFFGTVPTNPVGNGNSAVKLAISGQVNRTEVFGDDGRASEVRSLDNNTSSSRIRFQGEGAINSATSFGSIFELEIRPNSSSITSLTADQSNSVTNFTGGVANVGSTTGAPANNTTGTPTVRQVDVFVENQDLGAVHLGFGSTAGFLTSEQDLSGTAIASYVNVSDTDGGFSFRQRGKALIPSGAFAGAETVPCAIKVNAATGPTTAKTCINSPDAAFGPEVGSVFFFFDGKVRDDRVRYDSPVIGGFQFSTSEIDGGATDIAIRYGATIDDTIFTFSAAETFATSLTHAACAAFCYSSGNPTAANAAVGQPNGTELQTSPSSAGSNQFDGSFAILTPFGLALTLAGGVQDPIYVDPLKETVSPNLIFGKVGYLTPEPWFDFGKTAFAVSYAENQEVQFQNDDARDYAFIINQNFDPGAAQVFFAYHHQTLDRNFASYRPIDLALIGGIVRF
jgi:hypothetical protein